MRFDPHDLIYRLRHTLFYSFFFRVGGRRVDFFSCGRSARRLRKRRAGWHLERRAGWHPERRAGWHPERRWRNDIVKKGGMP